MEFLQGGCMRQYLDLDSGTPSSTSDEPAKKMSKTNTNYKEE